MASHIGSLAGGFATGFLNAYNAQIRAQYTRMLTEHYRYVMLAAGYNPQNHMFWDTDGKYGGGWNSPYQQPLPGTRDAYTQKWLKDNPNQGTMPPVGGGGGGGGGKGQYSYSDMIQFARNAGFTGEDIPHIVAIAQAESGGNSGATGKAGEIGLTQINPHTWGQEMADSARDPQGAFNAAHQVFEKQGWGAWSTDPSSPNFTSRNSMAAFLPDVTTAFKQAPTTTSTAPATAGPKAGDMSPAGGPYVSHDGQLYETNAKGEINPNPVSAQPSAAATPQAAETAAPAGGGFSIPGMERGIPTPDQLISLSSPQSDPNKAAQGYQSGGGRNPLARDPYWRANPPMAAPQRPQQPQKSPVTAPLPPPRPPGLGVEPLTPPRTPTPATAYPPSTPPTPPHTPTPATAYPQPTGAANAPPPAVARELAKEKPPELPPEAPPQAADVGGGGMSMPTTEPLPQQIPFVDPWVDFQQQNPYQPIVFQSRKGGSIGYDDGGSVGASAVDNLSDDDIKSLSQAGKSDQSKFTPSPIPSSTWTPYKDESPTNIGMVSSRKGGPIGYASGGDVRRAAAAASSLADRYISRTGGPGVAPQPYVPEWEQQARAIPVEEPQFSPKTQVFITRSGGVPQAQARLAQAYPNGPPPADHGDWVTLHSELMPQTSAPRPLTPPQVVGRPPVGLIGEEQQLQAQRENMPDPNAKMAERKGGSIGYADGGDIDPDNPSGPTAANVGTQLRNTGTAIALPVITRDLLRGLYTNPQQMQPRTGVPAPPAQPAPQPMNPAAQHPIDDPRNAPQPTYDESPMGQAGVAIRGWGAPAIGNAVINAGNWVDAHLPFSDQLKQYHDEMNASRDDIREQDTQWQRMLSSPADTSYPMYSNSKDDIAQTTREDRNVTERTYKKHARGGPVMGYAKGGVIMKFQDGGVTPYDPGIAPDTSRSAVSGFTYNPAYSVGENLNLEKNQLLYGTTTPSATADFGSAYNKLTPVQQNWLTQASTANPAAPWGGTNYNQLNASPISTPATATPTPAAAAPAAPSSRQLTSFIPPSAVVTPATTAVNVPSAPTTTNTTPTFGSGASTANANAIQSATNYSKYDDGGSVGMQGPSTLGPPPGLSGGGGQPVPPIYYNPGTYSQAGAPVGRGVSQNSLAAIYPAAAVPTYKRGGAVSRNNVMRYDDGGDVGGPEEDDTQPMPASYEAPTTDSSQADMPSPVAQPVSFMGGAGRTPSYARMPTVTTPGPRMPRPSATGGMGRGRAAGPGGGSIMDPDETDPSGWYEKPQGLPPEAPMIQDHSGNPSPGVTGALAAGMHFLGQFLEMGPWSQGLPSAQAQQERQAFASGQGVPSDRQVQKVMDTADPNHELGEMQRFMGALEMLYKYDILQGNPEQAQRDAACMLMYGREAAARYGREAIKHYYKGDVQGALDSLQDANNYTVDGSNWKADINKDGTIHAEKRNLNNSVLEWEANVAPQEILAAAVKVANGQAYWQMLEQAAYKYDPIAKAMVDQRGEAETQRQIEQYTPQRQYGPPVGGAGPQSSPVPSGPQQTPASTPADYPPSPLGGAPTTGSSPVPAPGALPPTMVGPAGAANQLLAPTGIGAQPGQPPATRADIQGVLQPQVADAGPGPGAAPSYQPSFDTTGAGAIPPPPPSPVPPSPVPTRADTTTAQPATPPPGSDDRLNVTPAASSELLRPDTIAQPNVSPMSDSEFAHMGERIATEERDKVLVGNNPVMENGRPWQYPELPAQLPADPKARKAVMDAVKNEQVEWRNAWTHANDTAKAMTASRMKDLSDQLSVARTLFDADKSRKAAATVEANREQATANAEAVKSEAARMKPAPEYFEDKTGMHMPVGALAKPAALAAFGAKDDATQLHDYLKSQESMNSVVDGVANVWRYNQFQTMGMERAASLVKTMVTDPLFGMQLGKDGKPIPDPDAMQEVKLRGDPGDKRTMIRVRDPRGGFAHFIVPTDTSEDLIKAHNEFMGGYATNKKKEDDRAAAEAERNKGVAGAASSAVTPVPMPLGRQPSGPGTIVSPLGPLLHPQPLGRGHGPIGAPQPPPQPPPFTRTLPRQGIPTP